MKCRRFFIASNYSWRCHQSQLSKRNQQPQHNKYNRKNKTAPKVGVIMVIVILQSLQYGNQLCLSNPHRTLISHIINYINRTECKIEKIPLSIPDNHSSRHCCHRLCHSSNHPVDGSHRKMPEDPSTSYLLLLKISFTMVNNSINNRF